MLDIWGKRVSWDVWNLKKEAFKEMQSVMIWVWTIQGIDIEDGEEMQIFEM